MFGKKSVETLVVGAGPSGMVAALSLAQSGRDVIIVDAAERSCTRSNALALHPATLELFARMGFSDRLVDAGYRIDKILVYDETDPRETVRLSELPSPFPLALGLPQWELESILLSELEARGVEVLWNHRVSELEMRGSHVIATVDRYSDRGMGYAISHTDKVVEKTLKIEARFVVAADGYNSQLRRYSRSELERLGTEQRYAFFEFETDMDPDHAIRVSYRDGRAVAQYPLLAGTSRLSFEYDELELPEENRNKERDPVQEDYEHGEHLGDARMRELIKQRVPWTVGDIQRVRYRALAPFEKRYLPDPATERLFFLGDAARHFGPLSMTGMNLGIQEADQMAGQIAGAASENEALRLLAALGQSMVGHWRAIGNLDRVSLPIEMADDWVAENRARILRALPATGETLEQLATQLFIHLKLDELVGAAPRA